MTESARSSDDQPTVVAPIVAPDDDVWPTHGSPCRHPHADADGCPPRAPDRGARRLGRRPARETPQAHLRPARAPLRRSGTSQQLARARAQAPGATAGAGGFGGFGGRSAAAAAGTVTLVQGKTLWVTTATGSLVKVMLSGSTTITRNANVTKAALAPGDTVVVQGSTAKGRRERSRRSRRPRKASRWPAGSAEALEVQRRPPAQRAVARRAESSSNTCRSSDAMR